MTPGRRNNLARDNRAAFTLVELIMVLIVITVIVALVAPSLSGFSAGRRNRDTATLLVALTNYARTQAINEARVYRLNVEPKTHALWLTASTGALFDRPSSDFGDQYEWSADVTLQADLPQHTDGMYLEFRSNGRNDPGTFQLTDKLGGLVVVTCESPTEQFHILSEDEMKARR